ncbi:hypothetical protein Tco_0876368 [Tanacetum coccineum]|uniref:Xylulose kinase-1 n=1 Tax=Tanacetum coccineum TaxID=301880 RepID=A0ABQ5BUU6_9ASTR
MVNLKFADTHNLVVFLSKPKESDGFKQIVDFLNAHPIKYALTVNPTIYTSCIEQFWSTVKAKTINGEVQLHALVDGKKIIVTESTVRRELQLEDAEGVDCLLNSTIFEQLPLMGAKTTAWNEFSSTMASAIIYEAVHKDLGDSLVRAATTASSLEAEQDSGNITKTRSKTTPNESSSLGTTSGGGLRHQETMGDTITQTKFENVSKLSNDPLLARGNTLRSGEDSLKLNELMELCTTLQQKVLDLEKTKTTQANDIASLKMRVKKLEKKISSRTHKLKRLYKVGLSARVESSRDEENLGENASKHGRRINAIDVDEDITLVNVPDDVDKEMFDVDTLTGDEVFVAEKEVAAKDVNLTPSVPVSAISTSTKVSVATITTAIIPTLRKGIVITELGEGESTRTTSSQQPSQNKGKGKMVKPEHVKKLSKKDQLKLDEDIALKLQAEIDEEEIIARAEEENIDEANIAWDDIQAKVDADYQLAKRLQAEEQGQFTIEQKDTLFKELVEQRRKHFAAKRAEEKRNKPSTKAQQKKTMITYLKNMKELEQVSTKKQKVDEDKGTAELQSLMEITPDEEEVTIDVVPLVVNSPSIVGWKIHKEGRKSYYQIMRADGKSQMYLVFSHMLKSFDREDLETLYKLVKTKYKSTRPVEDMDLILWGDLKTVFKPHVEDIERESAVVKPHHVIAPSSSRYSSNDMVHNHYLEEAKKQTHEIGRNSKTSVMPSARSQSTANGSKPKPRINNQKSRNWPASKSSCVTTKTVPIAEHSRNSRNFSDYKHFVCSTCQKCVFNANHDSCVTKFLNEVNSRAKVPSNKTTNRNKPVEQISVAKKPERQIPKGHRFSIKKTSVVHEKTMTPRSCLRWKPTGKIFNWS